MTEEERLKAEAEAKQKAEEKVKRDADNSPRPNIKLRGKATPATVEGEVYPVGVNPIMLPNLESQQKGFYHPRAAEIIRLYPMRKGVIANHGKATIFCYVLYGQTASK